MPDLYMTVLEIPKSYFRLLKGLGHAVLGNISANRMVIKLTKISK